MSTVTWLVPPTSTTPAMAPDTVPGAVTVDHVALALARLPQQFRSQSPMTDVAHRTSMEKFIAALITPFNDFEHAGQQILLLESIATGVGVTLDVIGRIVGQARGGLGDTDYRRYLSARVRVNRSAGKRRDMIAVARLVLDLAPGVGRVAVASQLHATTVVAITGVATPDETAAIAFAMLSDAIAAGERLVMTSSPADPATWFTLDVTPLDSGFVLIDARTT